jgi:hypothetical protein
MAKNDEVSGHEADAIRTPSFSGHALVLGKSRVVAHGEITSGPGTGAE